MASTEKVTQVYLHLVHYPTMNHLRKRIRKCEGDSHIQQVIYSTYHDGLTQVCFNCETVRTTVETGK
jgi:hypothetical protein